MNPCIELCWNRYSRHYSPECDNKCDYAKAVLENKALKQSLVQSASEQAAAEHGRWLDEYMVDQENLSMECSACGGRHIAYWKTIVPYCPNCGAKMDLKG